MSELLWAGCIKLQPVTKKNSQRIAKKGGRTFILPSAKYKEFEQASSLFLSKKPPEPISQSVNVMCVYYMQTRRRVDLVNLQEATLDVLVKHKILEDDNCRIVASMDGSRVCYDKENPRTEIYIEANKEE